MTSSPAKTEFSHSVTDGAGTGAGWGQIMSAGDGDNQATWGNLILSGTVTAVDLSDKLPMTWGSIKSRY